MEGIPWLIILLPLLEHGYILGFIRVEIGIHLAFG
jgi:hypothetical protein